MVGVLSGAAESIAQPITMVESNSLELGQMAAERLFERIHGDTSPPKQLVLSSSLSSHLKGRVEDDTER